MANVGDGSVPSAARVLSSSERADLAAIALALPPGWVVVVEAPYGQLAIMPRAEMRHHVGCWEADGQLRLIRRQRRLHALLR